MENPDIINTMDDDFNAYEAEMSALMDKKITLHKKNSELILDLHRMYCAGSDDPSEMERVVVKCNNKLFGIEFYIVGRNSSHEFYLGCDFTGRMYKAAIDCDDLEPITLREVPQGDGIGYIGHW